MFRILDFFWTPRQERQAINALYEAITQQSLKAWFYQELSVSDSFNGRFDVNALHAHLLIERLSRDSKISQKFSQRFFNSLFGHWDFALRESGVGDMSVGKHIKKLMQGFFGRAQSYTHALIAKDQEKLKAALVRNLGLGDAEPDQMRQAVSYVVGFSEFLWNISAEALLSGSLEIPEPAVLVEQGESLWS